MPPVLAYLRGRDARPLALSSRDARRRSRGARGSPLRRFGVALHRVVGLTIAVFLVIAGLTGSVVAFYEELDTLAASSLHHARSRDPLGAPLARWTLVERAEEQLPRGALVTWVPLESRPGKTLLLWVATPGRPDADDEYFVDPYDGSIVGARRWGSLAQGLHNVVPFAYRLHHTLGLGQVGITLLGIVGLLWTVDCFVGAYLTFPPPSGPRGRAPGRSWLRRWWPAWLLHTGKRFAVIFTWHRASGLWVWGMLFVFAWSAVGMNFTEVYNPVMQAAFGLEQRGYDRLPVLAAPRTDPNLSWQDALEEGRAHMQREASRRGFVVLEERGLGYYADRGMFQYRVRSSLDVSDRYPSTVLWLNGHTGEPTAFDAPTGQHVGNTITTWINHLHFGSIAVGGWPYRLFVAVMGLVVAALSITGAWIWWQKRSKHQQRRARAVRAHRAGPEDVRETTRP